MTTKKGWAEFIIHEFEGDGWYSYYIIEINGRAYARGYAYDNDKKTFYLDSLSVSPEYRKNGLGLKLQELREQIAREKGYIYTCLWTKKRRWTVKWYKRRGYKYYQKHDNKDSMWLRKKLF